MKSHYDCKFNTNWLNCGFCVHMSVIYKELNNRQVRVNEHYDSDTTWQS